jgi:hypothetical protein
MMNSKISTFRSALLVAALAFAPVTASLHAQTADRVQVNIPFAFQNGSTVLPAGTYTFADSNHILTVRGRVDSSLSLSRVEDSGSTAPKTGKVVFQRYGDKYFLREVWQANESNHTVVIKTIAEIKARKAFQVEIASTSTTPTTIEIATK